MLLSSIKFSAMLTTNLLTLDVPSRNGGYSKNIVGTYYLKYILFPFSLLIFNNYKFSEKSFEENENPQLSILKAPTVNITLNSTV